MSFSLSGQRWSLLQMLLACRRWSFIFSPYLPQCTAVNQHLKLSVQACSNLNGEHLHLCLHPIITPFAPKFKDIFTKQRCIFSHQYRNTFGMHNSGVVFLKLKYQSVNPLFVVPRYHGNFVLEYPWLLDVIDSIVCWTTTALYVTLSLYLILYLVFIQTTFHCRDFPNCELYGAPGRFEWHNTLQAIVC